MDVVKRIDDIIANFETQKTDSRDFSLKLQGGIEALTLLKNDISQTEAAPNVEAPKATKKRGRPKKETSGEGSTVS